jgi:hypothetical protein
LSRKPEKLLELVQSNAEKISVSEIVKSPFTFEFLGMSAKDVVVESDLEHYKRHEMREGDNLPVGILLVTSKNNTLVEYATGTLDNQLFVSRYLLELPKKEILENIVEQEMNSI